MGSKKSLKEQAQDYVENGMGAYRQERLEEAAECIQEAIHLFQQCGEEYFYAINTNLLGVIYAGIGNEAMAMECYLKGLEYAEKNELTMLFPLFYNNIGSRYQELSQPEKAARYFQKALDELRKKECRREERYPVWMVTTLVNLGEVYCAQGEVKQAEKLLRLLMKYMKEHQIWDYYQSYLVLYCSVCWKLGKKEEVYQNLDNLLEEMKRPGIMKEYVRNVKEVAQLLKECEEYQKWEQILHIVEEKVRTQGATYYQILITEMWLDYYQTVGKMEKYNECCVSYTELCKYQKTMDNREKAVALDMKIALHKKEKQWLEAEEKAGIDALTRLQNRYGLERDCKEFIHRFQGKEEMPVVGILDVDCFKMVNDTYGHVDGDGYLKAVAKILKSCVDGYGKAYRFGGDEFVVLITEGSRKAAERVAGKICEELEELRLPNEKSQISPTLTLSQGYACFQVKEGDTIGGILKRADKALYKVKKSGKNHYAVVCE